MEVQGQSKTIRRASLRKQKGHIEVALPAVKRIIIVATNRELMNEHRYKRQWTATKNIMAMHGYSRRGWVDFCIDTYRDTYGKYEFQWPCGMAYVLPDWDVLFSDPDCRWLSDYLEECKGEPKSHSPLYGRLRVFDAVIQIRWPNIAKRIRA